MSVTTNPRDQRLRVVRGQLPTIAVLAVGVAVIAILIQYVAPRLDDRDVVFLGTACLLAVTGAANSRFSVLLVVVGVVFGALLRRVFPAVDPAADIAAVVPFILMLPLAGRALRERCVPNSVVFGLLILAATAVKQPQTGAPAFLSLAAPLLAGLYIRSNPRLQTAFARDWLVAAAAAFGYGIYQFFRTPGFDAAWLVNARFSSAGLPGEPGFRPFATFASPGPAALAATLTILIAVSATRISSISLPLRALAASISVAYLAISGVRSAWIFGGVALVTALVSGGRRAVTLTIVPVVVAMAGVASQIPALASVFALRADSLGDLGSDKSYQARSSLLSSASRYFTLSGGGLGTGSNASRSGVSIDNGYIVVLAEGGIIGILCMAAIVYGVVRGTRVQSVPFVVLWLLANLSGYNFGNLVAFVVVAMLGVSAQHHLSTASDTAESGPDRILPTASRVVKTTSWDRARSPVNDPTAVGPHG